MCCTTTSILFGYKLLDVRHMYSEETEERAAREAALEDEREERGLSLSDTRDRVKKYDRLAKKTKIRVKVYVCR